MTEVRTASRLHFGLLSLAGTEPWANCEGSAVVPARRFGGAGLMIQAPGCVVRARPADAWSATGPLAERALAYAQRLAATLSPEIVRPLAVEVVVSGPHHVGLGTGTQLALAVGRAVAIELGAGDWSAVELASRLGRGARSGVGLHGFAQGGFLVEAGKSATTGLAPLVARCDFPTAWPLVIVLPNWATGLHGGPERVAFQQLHDRGTPTAPTDTLCRLVLLGMLPALTERDLPAFGEALYDFNRRVGEAFAPVQGGPYAHARLEEVVTFIRESGVAGVGQSSWGPTLFAVTHDGGQADDLVRRVRERFGLTDREVFVTAAANDGHEIKK
jgi:beta-RFAP synthase